MSSKLSKKDVADLIQALCIVVVDDNQRMRKMIRTLLVNCGIKDICEAPDGIAALDLIRTVGPDVVILDWEMPLLSGAELVRIVRSPGVFPIPDVPIIMLSGYGERWRVVEAVKLGVNEYLVKPVSAKALYDRLVSITMQPRPAVQLGDYYGPQPRKFSGESVETAPLAATPDGAGAPDDTRVRKMQALARVECQIYDSTNPMQRRTFFASPTKSAGVGG